MQTLETDNIIAIANRNLDKFTKSFIEWLPKNIHIWEEYERRALELWNKGFKQYSSRTIVYVMRYHADVSESDSKYKISNNHTPYLSRLWSVIHPDKADMFQYNKLLNETAEKRTDDLEFA